MKNLTQTVAALEKHHQNAIEREASNASSSSGSGLSQSSHFTTQPSLYSTVLSSAPEVVVRQPALNSSRKLNLVFSGIPEHQQGIPYWKRLRNDHDSVPALVVDKAKVELTTPILECRRLGKYDQSPCAGQFLLLLIDVMSVLSDRTKLKLPDNSPVYMCMSEKTT